MIEGSVRASPIFPNCCGVLQIFLNGKIDARRDRFFSTFIRIYLIIISKVNLIYVDFIYVAFLRYKANMSFVVIVDFFRSLKFVGYYYHITSYFLHCIVSVETKIGREVSYNMPKRSYCL